MKSSRKYDSDVANSFADGQTDNGLHNFYFFSRENNFLLVMSVVDDGPDNSLLLLTSMKDFDMGSECEWLYFNRTVSRVKQAQVLEWFNTNVKRGL